MCSLSIRIWSLSNMPNSIHLLDALSGDDRKCSKEQVRLVLTRFPAIDYQVTEEIDAARHKIPKCSLYVKIFNIWRLYQHHVYENLETHVLIHLHAVHPESAYSVLSQSLY